MKLKEQMKEELEELDGRIYEFLMELRGFFDCNIPIEVEMLIERCFPDHTDYIMNDEKE